MCWRSIGIRRFAAVACAVLVSTGHAADRILTFGGGPTPNDNQASLEKNVLYFQGVVKMLGLAGVRHDIYFADGTARGRSVQYRADADELTRLLADIYDGAADDVSLRFRPSSIPALTGPNTTAAIDGWFAAAARDLAPRDRVLIYFTGHGGQQDHPAHRGPHKKSGDERNTELYTWNNTPITVRDFITRLDTLDPAVDVTLVMVQCHSGGFANVIYNHGDPARGLSRQHRCGFFATIASRPAAGCTPDIDAEDYQEFSTLFFAAISGKTRTGQAVAPPDYNHDGCVTLTDAFTYVLLTSNTIDVPLATSDQFLQDQSAFRTKNTTDLLPRDAPYGKVLALATPAQQAALEGLSAQLQFTGDDRLATARTKAAKIEAQRKTVADQQKAAEDAVNAARDQIKQALGQRWPELEIPWHPQTAAVVAAEGAAIKQAVESHPAYKALLEAQEKLGAAADKDLTLERQWAKTQRLLLRAQTVILAANLDKVANAQTVAAYRELLARENRPLAPHGNIPGALCPGGAKP